VDIKGIRAACFLSLSPSRARVDYESIFAQRISTRRKIAEKRANIREKENTKSFRAGSQSRLMKFGKSQLSLHRERPGELLKFPRDEARQ